jgi:sulfur-oxidizing protein SoxB
MDLDIKDHKVIGYHYKMLPIITNLIKPDAEVVSYVDKMRQTKYDKNVVEARSRLVAFCSDSLSLYDL